LRGVWKTGLESVQIKKNCDENQGEALGAKKAKTIAMRGGGIRPNLGKGEISQPSHITEAVEVGGQTFSPRNGKEGLT